MPNWSVEFNASCGMHQRKQSNPLLAHYATLGVTVIGLKKKMFAGWGGMPGGLVIDKWRTHTEFVNVAFSL